MGEFIGGKARNAQFAQRKRKITGTGDKDKIMMVRIVERGGKVRTSIVPNRREKLYIPKLKSKLFRPLY